MKQLTQGYFPLYFVLAVLSFSPMRKLGLTPSPGELGLVLLLPLIAWQNLMQPLRTTPLIPIALFGLVAWLFLSTALQQDNPEISAFKTAASFMGHVAMFSACYGWLRAGQGRRALMEQALVILGVLLALLCMAQMAIGPDRAAVWMPWGPEWTTAYEGLGFRTYGFLDNPLLAGCFMTICLPFAQARWSSGLLAKACCLALVIGILFTGSRSCMLVAFALFFGRWWGHPSLLIIGALLAPPIILGIVLSPFGARFSELGQSGGDENLINRLEASKAAICMLSEHPVVGIGPGAFSDVYGCHYKPVISQDQVSAFTPDNLLLQLAAESGYIAALLALIAFGLALYFAYTCTPWQQGLSLAILVHGALTLGVALFATPLMWLLMVLFALAEHSRAEQRSAQAATPSQAFVGTPTLVGKLVVHVLQLGSPHVEICGDSQAC